MVDGFGVVDSGDLFWLEACYLVWFPGEPTLKQIIGKEAYQGVFLKSTSVGEVNAAELGR